MVVRIVALISVAMMVLGLVLGAACAAETAPEGALEPQEHLTVPNPPSSFNAEALSQTQVNLWWTDNSDNEEGFRIYRNGVLVVAVGKSVTSYQDTRLEAATSYSYTVKAYNDAGESYPCSRTVTTLNPRITVTVDRIGVLFDHDPVPLIQDEGEIYVYLAVSDGKSEPRWTRIPSTGAIELNDNETQTIGQQVFSTNSVGNELKIVAIALESDPGWSGMLRQLLVGALIDYLTGVPGLIGNLLTGSISGEEVATELAECPEDDFVGAIEITWTSQQRWGIGSHSDIRNEDFRLWFTIEELS